MDLLIGVPALLVATPVIAALAIAIRVVDRSGPFYFDTRVGLGGRDFRIWKLRTMRAGASTQGLGMLVALNDQRVTTIGRTVRRWSLDELPQLINVVRGDMSIVGPRPTYRAQVDRYPPRHRGRLRVRPGITGLAQVSGRNDLDWHERIERDLDYVERMSPLLDAQILLRTPLVVLRGVGLYGRRGVTPDYEAGSEP